MNWTEYAAKNPNCKTPAQAADEHQHSAPNQRGCCDSCGARIAECGHPLTVNDLTANCVLTVGHDGSHHYGWTALGDPDGEAVERAISLVADMNGDQRCGLNARHAGALVAALFRARAALADKDQAIRSARRARDLFQDDKHAAIEAAEKHITILRAQRDEWPQRVAALPWGRWCMELGVGNLDDIKNEVLNCCAADPQTACKSADNDCGCSGCVAAQRQSPCKCGHPARNHYLGDEGRTVFCRECGCTHDVMPEATRG